MGRRAGGWSTTSSFGVRGRICANAREGSAGVQGRREGLRRLCFPQWFRGPLRRVGRPARPSRGRACALPSRRLAARWRARRWRPRLRKGKETLFVSRSARASPRSTRDAVWRERKRGLFSLIRGTPGAQFSWSCKDIRLTRCASVVVSSVGSSKGESSAGAKTRGHHTTTSRAGGRLRTIVGRARQETPRGQSPCFEAPSRLLAERHDEAPRGRGVAGVVVPQLDGRLRQLPVQVAQLTGVRLVVRLTRDERPRKDKTRQKTPQKKNCVTRRLFQGSSGATNDTQVLREK